MDKAASVLVLFEWWGGLHACLLGLCVCVCFSVYDVTWVRVCLRARMVASDI